MTDRHGYPNKPLGPQIREFGECFSGFDVVRNHFLGKDKTITDTTTQQIEPVTQDVCSNCHGMIGELAEGRDPEELCDTCYDDMQATRTTPAPSGSSLTSPM
jgi:hypothetical protein